jgi:hypothetical protein
MTTRKYSSRSQKTTLASAITSSSNSITVVSATSLLGGLTIAAGETYTVVIDPDTALEEIVDIYKVDGNPVSGNTLAIVRTIDGSVAQAHSAGAEVRHMAIGRDYREANQHAENVTAAHGLTIANVVKTTDTSKVTGPMIVDGAVGSAKITDFAVTEAKLAASSVTTTKISDLNVTTAKLADLGVTTAKVADGAITSAKIADLGIATGDIADGAITSAKIADLTIATGDIADSAITSAKIANGTIVNADINDTAAIAATKISGTAVTQADTGTVTSAMILNGTIVDADVSDTAAIAKTKLNLGGTITSADLVDGTIVNADINATANIALSKLATDPLARANHTGTQTASTISDFDTQVRTNRLDQMAAPTGAVALNAQKITGLADPTNAQDAVTLNYITTQKGTANGIAELDGNGLVPVHHLPALAISETFVVATQSAMLALSAQVGDVAVRTDVNKSFILTATPASTLANWQELLTPTDAVLSVDGSTGAVSLSGTYINRTSGQLLGALDANTFKITNVGTPTNAGDATNKAYVDATAGTVANAIAAANAATAAYDAFDDRYLGSKSTAPTLDNDGDALLTGAMYWNSTNNTMYTYSGTAWIAISTSADIQRYRYTATGGETSKSGADDFGLTLAYTVGKEQVYLNGVLLARTSDYNATNGTSITGLAALAAGDILDVITFTPFVVSNSISNTLFTAKGDILIATGSATPGKLAVATDGWYLKANSSTLTGLEWAPNELLPSQTGNTGKFLTTNGTAASWAVVDLTQQANEIMTIMGAY